MDLYQCMQRFAISSRFTPANDHPTPELGESLSLLHACLVESHVAHEETPRGARLSALPEAMHPSHLSRFVVAFLPFNGIASQEATNQVLFDVYSFLKWMEKLEIPHGLEGIDFQTVVRDLTEDQNRCLKLSHFLDDESVRTLDEPPPIVQTLTDLFSVTKIDGEFVQLKGNQQEDTIRLRLPKSIIKLMRVGDILDLVMGDTSDRWVILEAGQVFPEFNEPRPENDQT